MKFVSSALSCIVVVSSLVVEALGREHVRRRPGPQHRGLVTRGTPTGGGKYPFFAVVDWGDGPDKEGGVSDPRDSTGIWCNGVMVAPDVLLTSLYCRPRHGYVMVGDSVDRTTNESVQFPRFTGDLFRDAVYHKDGWHRLFKVEPVTFPGFVPVVVNKDPDSIHIGQNLTVVSYGPADALVAYEYKNLTWTGQALEGTLEVTRLEVPNTQFWAGQDGEGVGVCAGDMVAPVLDSEMKLVALAGDWSCGNRSTNLFNFAYFAEFVERNTCAMSEYELSYCPTLVCPTDARVLGYPFAELPNGTSNVKGIRGFVPTRITQWPPPGTVLGKDSITNVTMTAMDASNLTLQCTWTVVVPPLELIGGVKQSLEIGSMNYSTVANLAVGGPNRGIVFKMRSILSEALQAEQKTTWVSYRKRPTASRRHSPYDGDIIMQANQTSASSYFPDPIPVVLNENDLPNVTVETAVLTNLAPNNETVLLYGQVEYYQ